MYFVYPLGNGSAVTDLELSVSASLVRKYFNETPKIIIVGEKPQRKVNEDLFIPCSFEGSRYQKSTFNLETAAKEIQDSFVLMNDDFMPCKPFGMQDLKNWYNMTIREKIQNCGSPAYRRTLSNSLRSKDDLNYAIHRPFLIDDLEVFLESCQISMNLPCSLRNIYGNKVNKNPVKIQDLKTDSVINLENIDWFSISDRFVKNKQNIEWLTGLM